eukprot:PhF_6_TR27820/c0_g1_i1/m.40578
MLTSFSVLSILCVGVIMAAAVSPPRCPGVANTIPIYTADPTFLATVPNGNLYQGGTGNDTFYIQHLYGTYYEMGYAHGELFADIIPTGLNRFYDWVEQQLEEKAPWIPAWLAGLIADFGVPVAMQFTWNQTAPFLPQKYQDEMTGIADGAKVSHADIFNINMIAELIKAQCSVIGANGAATANSKNGSLIHLRTLDGMGGATMPIKDYAIVTVYHPTNGDPATANFAWVSFVGSVTGFGEFVGIGEKYWDGVPDSLMSTQGEAWTFVTRDVLNTKSFAEAIQTLQNANRTCAIRLGIGARATNQFAGAQVAAKSFQLFNDTSVSPYPQHPVFPGIVYWDQYSQPTQSYCFADLFTQYHGDITIEILATKVAPVARTGDLHAVIMDYASQ